VLSAILFAIFSPVHAQTRDHGGYRPQYPPTPAALNTTGGRGGAFYIIDTLVWDRAQVACVGDCGGALTRPVCSEVGVRCFRGGLRDALAASGPRFVLPRISGYIDLPFVGDATFHVTNGDLTVAMQTAPSPGITARYSGIGVSASNVIIQHWRGRGGEAPGEDGPCGSGLYAANATWPTPPTIGNVIFDHVSLSMFMDDNMQVGDPTVGDVMVWRSISAMPLNYHSPAEAANCPQIAAFHGDSGHCIGIGSTQAGTALYFIETIGSNCHQRMFWGSGTRVRRVLINNIMHGFHPGAQVVAIGQNAEHGDPVAAFASLVANRYIANSVTCATQSHRAEVQQFTQGNQLFFANNVTVTPANCDVADILMYSAVNTPGNCPHPTLGACLTYNPLVSSQPTLAPLPTGNGWAPRPADEALEAHVIANAGARPSDRDAIDALIIDDIRSRTWRSIHDESNLPGGGWPPLAQHTRVLDIPANPHAIAPGQTFRTNVEVWLEGLAVALEGEEAPLVAPTGLRLVTGGS
jgi:hypothetical protein